jgi:hypothetical protein
LYYTRQYDEAYLAFLDVLKEREVAFEPSDGLNRSLEWELGLALFYANRFEEAVPHLETVVKSGQLSDRDSARRLLSFSLAKIGRSDAATVWQVDRSSNSATASEALDFQAVLTQSTLQAETESNR